MSTAAPLAGRTAGAVSILGAAGLMSQVVGAASAFVVAYYIGPDAYAQWAVAAMTIAFAEAIRGAGLVPSIITGRLGDELFAAGHWVSVIAAFVFGGLSFLAAPFIATSFDMPGATGIVRVASFAIMLAGWDVVPLAVLARRGQFKAVAILGVAAQLTGTISRVALAAAGFGVWAIAWSALGMSVLSVVTVWMLRPIRLTSPKGFAALRPFFAESRNITTFAVFNYATRNADNALIGWRLGATSLGLYAFAYDTMMKVMNVLTGPLSTPMLMSLGDLRHEPERFDAGVVRAATTIARISFPLFCFGAAEAPFVLAMVGSRWTPAVATLQVLLLLGAMQTLGTLQGSVWLALGRSRELMLWGVVTGAVAVLVFFIGTLTGSIVGVACIYAGYSSLLMLLGLVLTRRRMGLRLDGLIRGLLFVVRDLAIGGLALLAVRTSVGGRLAPWMEVAVEITAASLVYLIAFRVLSRPELSAMIRLMPRRLRRPACAALLVHEAADG